MSARPMSTSLIVPQYGQTICTARLLSQLQTRESESCDVVIVDDGSPLDDPFPWKAVPHQRYVRQLHAGVTAAWNNGARHAGGELLVFLNNDVRIEGPFVNRIQLELTNPAISLVGVTRREERAIPPALRQGRPFPLLEGWCFAVRRTDFEALNGFDESMRLYFSDTDFQWRMRERFPAKQFAVIPDLPLVHAGHATTRILPERREIWHRDRQQFIEKWTGR